ncbi:lytic polysaccharide monooxygenase auxiliary activity family 9 protein [Streptomyces rectiviolaceus]|uniref:lytic polysaccharide monooxygenase auxiliary activity family 9 protein n=1 Tax=Streptomyces rectiviolaceus TaxID=332591 RepID=UPI0036365239
MHAQEAEVGRHDRCGPGTGPRPHAADRFGQRARIRQRTGEQAGAVRRAHDRVRRHQVRTPERRGAQGPAQLPWRQRPVRGAERRQQGWKVSDVSRTQTFTWTFTARHRTANYEYFVDGTKVATIDGGNQQPPATVSHQVNLGSATGRHKVLAVWNIGDTSNAFYACIDVNIR